jgi:hypothetical protein
MVDLKWLVQKFYYHPAMAGSNSIKVVLPAMLSESEFLQRKYERPIYGSKGGIFSHNFRDHSWLTFDHKGEVKDPYKTLKPIFDDVDPPRFSFYGDDDRIAEGGAAMTAFARMQFTEMAEAEHKRVAEALLRYCELDTFAMVMICEHWLDKIKKAAAKSQQVA